MFRPLALVSIMLLAAACAGPDRPLRPFPEAMLGQQPEPSWRDSVRRLVLECEDGERLEVAADGYAAAVTNDRGRRVLQRLPDAPGESYTNGWLTLILEAGGGRYATGRRAFTDCSRQAG